MCVCVWGGGGGGECVHARAPACLLCGYHLKALLLFV